MIYPKPSLSASQQKTRSAFTLIELLVVIAIIAILAAILFPVFARARENARRSSCQSNMKQIALGIIQYQQDYDEKFPLAMMSPAPGSVLGWSAVIQPYIKSTQILQCPSEPNPGNNGTPQASGYTDYWYNASLSWNGEPTATGGTANYATSVSTASVLFPTLTIMTGDGGGSNTTYSAQRLNGNSCTSREDFAKPGVPANAGFSVATCNSGLRHLDGINLSYTDGHVKWSKSEYAESSKIYNQVTGFTSTTPSSGDSPTFNVSIP